MKNRINSKVSWTLVIILLIFFFPVGIPMLIKKVKSEKFAFDQNGKTMVILGWVFVVFGLSSLGEFSSNEVDFSQIIFMSILFGGGGIALIYFGNKYRAKAKTINKYMSIIGSQNELYIGNISSILSISYENVLRDLQYMIDEGFLINSHIDLQLGQLVVNKQENSNQFRKMVKCSFCGANTLATHEGLNKCEFCGSNYVV